MPLVSAKGLDFSPGGAFFSANPAFRWSRVYERGVLNGETAADVKMMTIDQEIFEDPLVQSEPQKR